MYIKNVLNQISIILLWVDDILIASKTKAYMNNGKFQSLDLMQPCYLENVSFVSLN